MNNPALLLNQRDIFLDLFHRRKIGLPLDLPRSRGLALRFSFSTA